MRPRSEALPVDAQIRTLAAGVVVVQHRSDLDEAERERLVALVDHDRTVVAPNDDLPEEAVVVATSWRHRMPLERVDTDLLAAFVRGYADRAPDLADCPRPGRPSRPGGPRWCRGRSLHPLRPAAVGDVHT